MDEPFFAGELWPIIAVAGVCAMIFGIALYAAWRHAGRPNANTHPDHSKGWEDPS